MSKLAKALAAAAGNASGAEPDPDFNRVSLLLNGDGTDGGQNNTYTDSSSNGHTMTPAGTIEQGSVSPFGDNWSVFVNAAGDRLTTTESLGSGDFTVEFWAYTINAQDDAFFDTRTVDRNPTGLTFTALNSTTVRIYDSAIRLTVTGISYLNQWVHFAIERSSGTITIYVNGTAGNSVANTTNYSDTNFSIGDSPHYGDTDAYISNFRLVKGSAVYNGNFTPPTEPLTAISGTELLTCQSNRFVDNSTNALTLTVSGTPEVTSFSPFASSEAITLASNGGSAYFDGTSGYLSIADDPSLEVGSNDFTLECWLYNTGSSYNNAGIAGKWDVAAGLRSYAFYFNTSSRLAFAISSSGAFQSGNVITSTITASSLLNEWNHIRACKSGTTTYLFLNGISVGSTTVDPTVFNGTQNFYVGKINTDLIEGYVSNVRLINGTALSTSNFTPPTAPLTAITNTELLLNFEDAAIFDYAAINNVNTVGNADISTAVVKYGTGSLAFDGTGDYLNLPVNPTLSFGVADFTIEGWMNVASIDATYRCIFSIGAPVQIYARSGTIECYFDSDDSGSPYMVNSLQGPASSITANTWHYFTVVRNGTTFTAYIDGVAGTPDTGVTGAVATSANAAAIGIYSGSNTLPFTGYLDDLRITKGLARYTSAFTPPTAALPTF